jgi:hypothetical protein
MVFGAAVGDGVGLGVTGGVGWVHPAMTTMATIAMARRMKIVLASFMFTNSSPYRGSILRFSISKIFRPKSPPQ